MAETTDSPTSAGYLLDCSNVVVEGATFENYSGGVYVTPPRFPAEERAWDEGHRDACEDSCCSCEDGPAPRNPYRQP